MGGGGYVRFTFRILDSNLVAMLGWAARKRGIVDDLQIPASRHKVVGHYEHKLNSVRRVQGQSRNGWPNHVQDGGLDSW